MAVLNSKFDILRGWPQSSAVAEDFSVPAAVTNNAHKAGLWVELDPAVAAGYTTANVAAAKDATTAVALIIEGKEDYSSTMSGTTTCLLGGGYVVKLTNGDGYDMFATVDGNAKTYVYSPGAPVRVEANIIYPFFTTAGGGGAPVAMNLPAAAAATAGVPAPDDVDTAIDLAVASIELAAAQTAGIVGHVLKHDSTNGTLEIYVN
jgi:hypothetical protein